MILVEEKRYAMLKFKLKILIGLIITQWLLPNSLLTQTGCNCGFMTVPVFNHDFSETVMSEKIWDLDLQTHSRTWEDTPEQQYYVNDWHTWWNPDELTGFSYSSQAGSDVLTKKI